MVADIDVLVQQASIGHSCKLAVDQPHKHVWILQTVPVPAQQLGVNAHAHDVVEIILDIHHPLQIGKHERHFFFPGCAYEHGATIFKLGRCVGPGRHLQGRSLEKRLDLAHLEGYLVFGDFFWRFKFHDQVPPSMEIKFGQMYITS